MILQNMKYISEQQADVYFSFKENLFRTYTKYETFSKKLISSDSLKNDNNLDLFFRRNRLLQKRNHFNSFKFFTELQLQEMFNGKARSSYNEGFQMNRYHRMTFDDYISLQFVDLE